MLLGASVDGGAAYKMVGSERTGAEGDSSESRSGITFVHRHFLCTLSRMHSEEEWLGGGAPSITVIIRPLK